MRLVPLLSLLMAAPLAFHGAPQIVALGDSLTSGYGTPTRHAYPALLQERISEAGLSYDVINAGRSGATSLDGLRRLPDVLECAGARAS